MPDDGREVRGFPVPVPGDTGTATDRVNVVRMLRTATSNNPPPDNFLVDGEMCIEQNDPMRVWIGVPTSLSANGKRLLFDSTASGLGDAPTDGFAYGRQTGSWKPVLPLVGGTMQGGISFDDMVPASGTDTSKHITLGATKGMGLNGDGSGNINYVVTSGSHIFRIGASSTPLQISTAQTYVSNPALFSSTVSVTSNAPSITISSTSAVNWPNLTFNATQQGVATGFLQAERNGNPRWTIELGGTEAETGGDAGNNFAINAFHDTGGGLIGTAIKIWRASAQVQINFGLTFGSQFAASNTTLAKHIALWGTTYGFNVTSANLNYVSGGNHTFLINGAQIGQFTAGGLLLAADPTAALGAATKQYVDGKVVGGATVAPLMDGAAAVGTSNLYARQDHVHPSDTSRMTQAQADGRYLQLTGGTLSGGLGFGSTFASGGVSDVTRHIALYGTTYGLNVFNNNLDYVVPSGSAHMFIAAGLALATLSTTGVQVLVPLAVGNSSAAQPVSINGAAGQVRSILFQTAASSRWMLQVDGSAESGSNAGSNLQLLAYPDTGTGPTTVLSITRATGLATVAGDPTVPLGIATKQYVDNRMAAGSVASFNTRVGAVVLLASDVTGVGGAMSASPAFTGTPTAPTASVGTNNTQIATTAFVQAALPQPATTAPFGDGTANVGTSVLYARQDHIHPTDTSRAPLNAPAFTGIPTAPTASVGTSTTQIATTAFVQAAQVTPSASLPLMDGTAAIGVAVAYARADHVHPFPTPLNVDGGNF